MRRPWHSRQDHRKNLITFCIAAIVATSAFAGGSSRALANCNPQYPDSPHHTSSDNPTNRPTGNVDEQDAEDVQPHILPGYYLGGVYADATFYPNPWMDTYNGDQTTTWVMEQEPNAQYLFVQVGFWNGWDNGQSQKLFVEADPTGQPSGNQMLTFNPPAAGPQYYLTITNGTNGWYNLFVNEGSGNVLLASANMGTGDVPLITQADLASETHSLASQMPGGYNDSVIFSNATVYYNGAWQNFGPGSLAYDPYFYNAAIINPTTFAENDTSCLN